MPKPPPLTQHSSEASSAQQPNVQALNSAQEGSASNPQSHTQPPCLLFYWSLRLEQPSNSDTSHSPSQGAVCVRFLGPATAYVRVPFTLAWLITRLDAASRSAETSSDSGRQAARVQGAESELLAYKCEQPRGQQPLSMATHSQGVVRLGMQPGATAVVQVETCATVAGAFAPPELCFGGSLVVVSSTNWQPNVVLVGATHEY